MDFLALCAARYSLRSYAPDPVPDAVLQEILEAGRLAPTAMNNQPQRIFVIRSSEAMEKLTAVKPCFGAPVVLLFCADTAAACDRPVTDHNMGEMDVSIVATHVMLAATNAGVGSCWVCAFEPAKVAEALDIPAGLTPCLLMPLGYPGGERGRPSHRHGQREPLEATVTYL